MIEYFNGVSFDAYREVGSDAAILLAYLAYISRRLPADVTGHFSLDSKYVSNGLGMKNTTFKNCRRRLVEKGYLDYVPGNNQNAKPRYKVLK